MKINKPIKYLLVAIVILCISVGSFIAGYRNAMGRMAVGKVLQGFMSLSYIDKNRIEELKQMQRDNIWISIERLYNFSKSFILLPREKKAAKSRLLDVAAYFEKNPMEINKPIERDLRKDLIKKTDEKIKKGEISKEDGKIEKALVDNDAYDAISDTMNYIQTLQYEYDIKAKKILDNIKK